MNENFCVKYIINACKEGLDIVKSQSISFTPHVTFCVEQDALFHEIRNSIEKHLNEEITKMKEDKENYAPDSSVFSKIISTVWLNTLNETLHHDDNYEFSKTAKVEMHKIKCEKYPKIEQKFLELVRAYVVQQENTIRIILPMNTQTKEVSMINVPKHANNAHAALIYITRVSILLAWSFPLGILPENLENPFYETYEDEDGEQQCVSLSISGDRAKRSLFQELTIRGNSGAKECFNIFHWNRNKAWPVRDKQLMEADRARNAAKKTQQKKWSLFDAPDMCVKPPPHTIIHKPAIKVAEQQTYTNPFYEIDSQNKGNNSDYREEDEADKSANTQTDFIISFEDLHENSQLFKECLQELDDIMMRQRNNVVRSNELKESIVNQLRITSTLFTSADVKYNSAFDAPISEISKLYAELTEIEAKNEEIKRAVIDIIRRSGYTVKSSVMSVSDLRSWLALKAYA